MSGLWCDKAYSIATERLPSAGSDDGEGRALVMRPSSQASTEFPFVLQWRGYDADVGSSGRGQFRRVMGPEKWLPDSWPGCTGDLTILVELARH